MSDLIRRADAIEAIVNTGSKVAYRNSSQSVLFGSAFRQNEIIDIIKALPSAEAVSRDAIMSAKFHPYPYTHITPTDADAESYKRGWNDALDAVADNAPSAEAVQGWIPCSERLPSEDGCYLVSTTGTNNDIIDIAYYTEEIWHKASRIKAWMPLPDPYREDGEA